MECLRQWPLLRGLAVFRDVFATNPSPHEVRKRRRVAGEVVIFTLSELPILTARACTKGENNGGIGEEVIRGNGDECRWVGDMRDHGMNAW